MLSSISRPGETGPSRNGRMERNFFRLLRFSRLLGQPREVHPKFRNEIPENVCSIRSPKVVPKSYRLEGPPRSTRNEYPIRLAFGNFSVYTTG